MKKPNAARPFDIAELEQIIAWLEDRDLYEIEIEEAGRRVRIVMAGRAPASAGAGQPPEVDGPTETVAAQSTGVCLTAHPDRGADLVRPGDQVDAGDVLALLKIGPLLVPVSAPGNGTVVRRLVDPGTTVGYGTPLFEIRSAPAETPNNRSSGR